MSRPLYEKSTMSDASDPIPRRKLSDSVRERLLRSITSGAIGPGDSLPSERELMVTYGVGRPAIREAMQSMQNSGLIEVRHGGRARVAHATVGIAFDQMHATMRHVLTHSAPTLEHLKEVRLATETHLVRQAAQLRDEDDIIELRRILKAQDAARGDAEAFRILDGAFHEAIARSAGNPVFTTLSQAVFTWLSEFHLTAVHQPGLETLTITEHEGILNAIAARDPDRAREAMTDHLNRANKLYATEHLRAT